jgi:flagellum-specific ATP synthase
MLSRALAHEGHFPAIDVLQSASRLASTLASEVERELMLAATSALATYERNRQMIDMGAYSAGSSAAVDRAITLFPRLRAVLRQPVRDSSDRATAFGRLREALKEDA